MALARESWRALLGACVVLAAVLVPWMSAADHALYPPDEGRYAVVSRAMAEGGSWLVPMRDGRPHLTKPPLAYWLQAVSIALLGPTSLAPRIPSLVAGSVAVLLATGLGWRILGPRGGVLTAGLLAAMPLHLVAQRLAITDSLLAMFWLAALGGGLLAAETGRRRWVVALWAAIAAGLMIKGPVALIPVVVLVVWLLLGRRGRDLRRLHVVAGLPLAALPIAAWAGLVWLFHPQAVEIWRHEIVDRALGEGDHSEPIWFFIPVVLAGCFPATAMLTLPMFNTSWGAAWRHVRSGSPAALLTLAILVPLLILSLNSGKLPTYALPLAAPMALVGAMTLERWLGGRLANHPDVRRPPDVRWTIGVVLLLTGPGAFIAATWFLPEAGRLPVLLLMPTAGAVVAMAVWSRGVRWREGALGAIFAGWMVAVATGVELEDVVRARSDPRGVLGEVASRAGNPALPVLTFGLLDGTVDYYAAPAQVIARTDDPLEADVPESPRIVLADERAWHDYALQWPERAAHFDIVATKFLWPRRRVFVLEPARRTMSRAGESVARGGAGADLAATARLR